MATEDPVKNTVDKVDLKTHHNGKYNNSGVGSSTKSVATSHKCGKKGHIKGISNPIEMVLMGNYLRDQQKTSKMSHQEVYDFKFRIYENIHHEP